VNGVGFIDSLFTEALSSDNVIYSGVEIFL
jgi:hypothetical protein